MRRALGEQQQAHTMQRGEARHESRRPFGIVRHGRCIAKVIQLFAHEVTSRF
jgi:hypothetical protein